MNKTALAAFVVLIACSKKDTPPAPGPEATPTPVAAKPAEPDKPAYSPAAAKAAIDQLATCSSQYNCKPYDTLVAFGAPAGADLVAFATDASKPLEPRRLAVAAVGQLKVAGAGPKLVAAGLAEKDGVAGMDFFKAAGECGGDDTFAALTAQYDKENHGDMGDHLTELRQGISAFPEKAMAWATAAMPKAKDATKYADVISDVAKPADKDAIAALVGTIKDKMANNRLAAKAIELGATDGKLWDALIAGLESDNNFDHDDVGNFLEPIASKIPADKKQKVIDLIKKALAKDMKDPTMQMGLTKTLAALGG
jgi:hypothetical protein